MKMVLFLGLVMLLLKGKKRGIQTAATALKREGDIHGSPEDVRSLGKQGRLKEALHTLHAIDQPVDRSTYVCVLGVCIKERALSDGKLVHSHTILRGFLPDKLLQNTLLNMYAKYGSPEDARRFFDQMLIRDVCSWSVMIAAYSRHGFAEEALTFFHQMQRTGIQPNEFTFASVLPACANLTALDKGMEIHEGITRRGFQFNVFVGNSLVDMYAKCGCIEKARSLFDKMSARDVVSWTAMIAGYAQNGQSVEALNLFKQMQLAVVKPDAKMFASVLSACANLATLEQGMEIQAYIIRTGLQSDVFVESALVDMYAKCGTIIKARNVFDKMPQRNVVSWTAIIAGYARNGDIDEAQKLFGKMPKSDAISWTSMVGGYTENGHADETLNLFQRIPQRDVVSWNAMIAGYAQNGQSVEALKLFRQMKLAGAKPDSKTFASVLPACANLAALEQGVEIHEEIIRSGCQSDVFVANALLDMYAKCGSIEKARDLFRKMHERNTVSWTAMIAGYGIHGHGKEALKLFEQMQRSGINPDHVTLVCVLSACCYAGLVDKGWHYFDCMSQYYHITPTMEHYACMVDLLGRAGRLDEAQDFVNKMPIEPDATVWGCLLAACRIHNNVELGESVAEHLFNLNPKNAAPYVLLSNIYAVAGRWDDIENLRKIMKHKKVRKVPGCSWIEIDKQVHAFLVGDSSHPQMQKIYGKLETLYRQMKTAGYVPNTRFVMNDVEEEQKEQILCHHSEKIAIAFGLINTAPGTVIRVIKNLRVCGDCHSAIKFISKIVAREIVLRDANRYHNFKDGWCSCGDYW
eukprot:Gb_35466 [translate_table: standard]